MFIPENFVSPISLHTPHKCSQHLMTVSPDAAELYSPPLTWISVTGVIPQTELCSEQCRAMLVLVCPPNGC